MSTHTQFGGPPARSDALEALFPPGVAAAELRAPGDPALLDPEEALAVARAVPKRRQEFAAGRLCARSALARLGVTQFALRAAPDRQPLWPDAFVGSITHTAGFCAAVVAPRSGFAALGVDTEIAGGVEAKLWPSICVAGELDWLESLPPTQRAQAATLLFCAKEAFYKCQYPHTGEWLDFADLQIAPLEWGGEQGAFKVEPQRPLALFAEGGQFSPQALRTAYRFHEQFLSAGVALMLTLSK